MPDPNNALETCLRQIRAAIVKHTNVDLMYGFANKAMMTEIRSAVVIAISLEKSDA